MAYASFKRVLECDDNNPRPKKRRRCNPYEQTVPDKSSFVSDNSNVFAQAHHTTLSSEQIAINICNEIKRLQKRKQLTLGRAPVEGMQYPESGAEKLLFTYKQVQLICARMVQEQREELCNKYNEILTVRLAEQYDAFVKFTYDQIQRRFEGAPSYLS